jgi:hypothetical protein
MTSGSCQDAFRPTCPKSPAVDKNIVAAGQVEQLSVEAVGPATKGLSGSDASSLVNSRPRRTRHRGDDCRDAEHVRGNRVANVGGAEHSPSVEPCPPPRHSCAAAA